MIDWVEANLSLQLAAEERVGWLLRQNALDAKRAEDAAFDALAAQMGGVTRP